MFSKAKKYNKSRRCKTLFETSSNLHDAISVKKILVIRILVNYLLALQLTYNIIDTSTTLSNMVELIFSTTFCGTIITLTCADITSLSKIFFIIVFERCAIASVCVCLWEWNGGTGNPLVFVDVYQGGTFLRSTTTSIRAVHTWSASTPSDFPFDRLR